MPQQMRQELVDAFDGVDLVDLRAADARGVHMRKHLAVLERIRQGELVDDQRLAGFDEDCRLGSLDIHQQRPVTRNR
ncbi:MULTISPECIES: hypothetical protein [Bradyrhizobium]|uniref:hypothetical protein n=1 Tax=Bradyrhizobium TaxID=374 RepID=UPI001FDA6BE1|nr:MULTISPECIES: hypothetical protein [Bradyrhizobium]WLB88744.1 hypothetical protein QIH91_40455 [Bradyrhizobium japonicum USDA 135]GLR98747.1 hypothetical protein GCM10007858_63900 [Bradyrhizobium liaoningense]